MDLQYFPHISKYYITFHSTFIKTNQHHISTLIYVPLTTTAHLIHGLNERGQDNEHDHPHEEGSVWSRQFSETSLYGQQ